MPAMAEPQRNRFAMALDPRVPIYRDSYNEYFVLVLSAGGAAAGTQVPLYIVMAITGIWNVGVFVAACVVFELAVIFGLARPQMQPRERVGWVVLWGATTAIWRWPSTTWWPSRRSEPHAALALRPGRSAAGRGRCRATCRAVVAHAALREVPPSEEWAGRFDSAAARARPPATRGSAAGQATVAGGRGGVLPSLPVVASLHGARRTADRQGRPLGGECRDPKSFPSVRVAPVREAQDLRAKAADRGRRRASSRRWPVLAPPRERRVLSPAVF